MRILDALLGRTRPVEADLDRLFALPAAAVTLQATLGLAPTGRAGVCFKPATAAGFADTQTELTGLLAVDHETVDIVDDRYGYRWVLLTNPALEDLVTAAHLVNATLADRGFGPQLLCSAFAFEATDSAPPVLLVYLYKRGTFYPFAPTGGQNRDNQAELSIRAALGDELPLEEDLARWFPLWDAPLLPPRPDETPGSSAPLADQPTSPPAERPHRHHSC